MKKIVTFLVAAMLATSTAHAVQLKMLYYLDRSDPVTTATFETLLDTFHAQNPDVELEVEYLFDDAFHNKLQTMAVAGQLPDIIFLWPGKRTGYVTSQGLLKDLRPWIEGHEDEFADGALAAQGKNGEIYELPEMQTVTHVMYANEKLMKELGLTYPKTLDELMKQGETIREAGYTPIAMTNRVGWQMQSCLLSMLAQRTGGQEWLNKAFAGDGASFADQEFVNALNVIKTLSDSEMFSPGINQADYGAALTEFVTEQAVYYIDGGWRVNNLRGELNDEQKEYMSLNVFPEVPDQKGVAGATSAVAGTGFGMNINLEGEEAEGAWKWIWFYSGPVGSKIRMESGTLTAYKLPVDESQDLTIKKLADFVAAVPTGPVLDAKMDGESMSVLQAGIQEMMLGAKTPEQVAKEFEEWVAANDSSRK